MILDNVNVSAEISFPEKNSKNKLTMQSMNLLCKKLNFYNFMELKELDSNQILVYLDEIKSNFIREKISPYTCGITLYNLVIYYIYLILEIISDKFNEKNYNIF